MARWLLGALVGVLLFYPGAEVLRWLVVDVLGLYENMTLQEALLAEVVILLTTFLVGGLIASHPSSGSGDTGSGEGSGRTRRR